MNYSTQRASPPCHDIALHRGNSAFFTLKPINGDGEKITLKEGDRILFTVRPRPDKQSAVVFSRVFDMNDYDEEGQIVLHLKPKDTVEFQVHTYWYDVAICFADGSFFTFVPFSRFDILPALGDVDMLSTYEDKGSGGRVCGNIQGVVGRPSTVYERELRFKTYKEFPAVGEADKLYVATDEDAVYRFDAELNDYTIIGSNPANIKEIYCKL